MTQFENNNKTLIKILGQRVNAGSLEVGWQDHHSVTKYYTEEDEWLERTREHIGILPNGEINTLFPALAVEQRIKNFGKIIRQMANDTDPINLIANDGL